MSIVRAVAWGMVTYRGKSTCEYNEIFLAIKEELKQHNITIEHTKTHFGMVLYTVRLPTSPYYKHRDITLRSACRAAIDWVEGVKG